MVRASGDDPGRGGRSSLRSAVAVLVAALVLLVTAGLVDAGADDPPDSTVPPDSVEEPTSTTVEVTDPGDVGSTSTVRGAVTTTTAASVTTTTVGPGAFGPPRIDPDAPPEPPMRDPSPEVRILLEQLLEQSHAKLVVRESEVVVENKIDVGRFVTAERAARDDLSTSRAMLRLVESRLDSIADMLRADAMARYTDPGMTGLQRLVDTDGDSGRTRAVLVEVTTQLHLEQREEALADKARLEATIQTEGEKLAEATRATERARQRAAQARERARIAAENIENERRFIEQVNAAIESDRIATRAATIGDTADGWSLPIAGRSVFTAEELARWFKGRGFPFRARASIDDMARYYIDEGADQGIRGDMAFAQSILETGAFTNRDTTGLNNFAGIGHCDSCSSGFAFATPELGVRAQMQLLADYTQRGVTLAHPMVDRRLRGPSGCCQTWWQLTHTWATAGNYGPKIMTVYREMLYWLVLERGMTPAVSIR